MLVFRQMVMFVLLMLVGAGTRKKKILTDENQPQITQLVLNIAYPAIILSGVTGDGPHIAGQELLSAGRVILAMLAVLLLVARLLPKLLGYPASQQGMVNVMTVFTNIGFMGVPMIDGIYGKDTLIYMTLLLIPFNLLFFSYVMQTIKGGGSQAEPFRLKSLLNRGMISCVLALTTAAAVVTMPLVALATGLG
ncbi:AEC family transporter [Acidaminococcus massiliensis]|uniref:AEC family transporter n=1 Tax=Acidaminococcus massiliensis TaxID=1852375 RepID=UPI0035209024